MGKNFRASLHTINTFILDYDGVLTDGNVILTSEGEALRTANVKDGYAMQLAMKRGYRIIVISGGDSKSTLKRLENLGVKDIYLGVENKLEIYDSLIEKYQLSPEHIIYMGDDIPDMKPMHKAGVACCPADAAEEIKNICDYISHKDGGRGCVRDIIEQVMKIQEQWLNHDAFHW
ncbi:MAG: HAD-IIIA family hydrolase [Bacteroidales bacterium]|nr:HAD-IIIA family hydrolase [Bacteroidales bacterium]MCF8334113.1 HAD-IIIA family hydrolase [Bacteroidales bacterium]